LHARKNTKKRQKTEQLNVKIAYENKRKRRSSENFLVITMKHVFTKISTKIKVMMIMKSTLLFL